MGYTHYYAESEAPTEKEVITEFKVHYYEMVKTVKASISTELDTEKELYFNGVDDNAHETFCLSFSGGGSWQFCKTAKKPYDVLVVACLVLAEELGIISEWSSDGEKEKHEKGRDLLRKVKSKIKSSK